MIRKDGRNVLRTPSLAETVMQPPDFPYTKQDLALQEKKLPYTKAKAHWLTPRAQESNESQATFLARNDDRTDRCFNSLTGQAVLWPTAAATDGEKGGPNSRHGSGSLHLPSAAIQTQWYTPNVPNGGRKNPPDMSATGKMPNGKKRQVGLENQAIQIWPTPMANPNTNRQTKPTPSQLKGEHGLNLAMVAVQSSWPTPRTCGGKRSSGSNRTELVNAWATPQAHDAAQGNAQRVGRFGTKAGGRNLTDEIVAWATPQSTDYRDRGNLSHPCIQRRIAAGKQINLSMMAHPMTFQSGPQNPTIMSNGKTSALTLNPLFVEWLMGWPINWTVASIGCASAATGLSLWLPLMRSELSRLLLASTSEQPDLFAGLRG